MKKGFAVFLLVVLGLSLVSFVLSFFPIPGTPYYLYGGIPFLAWACYSLHECAHALMAKAFGSKIVAIWLFPFVIRDGKLGIYGDKMAVSFIEPSHVKSAWIYLAGFLFTLTLFGGFFAWFILAASKLALVLTVVSASYFLTTPFPGGDIYNAIRAFKKQRRKQ